MRFAKPLLGLVAAASVFGATPGVLTAEQRQVSNGSIVFASDRDGNREIYYMGLSGGQTRLTYEAGWEHASPAWSIRDQIAFATNRFGNWEIYTMRSDGSGFQNLTNNRAADVDPTWSPDGDRLAFSSSRDGDSEIYVVNRDGTGLEKVTDNTVADAHPAWSPDGNRIAFDRIEASGADIWTVRPDGADATNVTQSAAGRRTARGLQ